MTISRKSDPFRVWIVDTSRAPGDADFDALDSVERERSLRFARAADRQAFVRTRAALRHLLADALVTTPRSIRLAQNSWGKPFAISDALPVDFNVSHSATLSVVALSDGRRIGVDVEQIRPVPDKREIVTEVLGADIADTLCNLDGIIQDRAFLKLWTAAEAYVKATGTGFAGLDGPIPLSLSAGTGAVSLLTADPAAAPWAHFELKLPDGYCGSLVVENLGGSPCEPVTPAAMTL